MSVSFEVNAQSRRDNGKGASRRLRRTGLVPGILYGGKKEPAMISLVHHELVLQLDNNAFYSHILNLNLGGETEKVVLKDVQRHPARPLIMHVDLMRVSATEKIRMTVPLVFLNEETAKGVKMGGQVMPQITEVDVVCFPQDLPESIEIDLAQMELGDSVHLSEIPLPNGVELEHVPDPDLPVVSISEIRGMEEAEVEEAEAEEVGKAEGEAEESED